MNSPHSTDQVQLDGLPPNSEVRPPDPAGDEWERDLAQVNALRTEQTIARLDRQFGGELDALLEGVSTSGPIRSFSALKQQRLVPDIESIGRVLTDDWLRSNPPEAAIGPGDGLAPDSSGWRRSSVVAAELEGAAIIRFANASSLVPGLAFICDDLGAALSALTNVSVLASGRNALPLHRRENWATLVVPITGPLTVDGFGRLVEVGEAVLVPPGSWFAIKGGGLWWAEIAVSPFGHPDVQAYLVDRAASYPPFRESIPWDPSSVPPSPGSIFGSKDGLREQLLSLDMDSIRSSALAWRRATLRPISSMHVGLAAQLLREPGLATIAAPGGWMVVESVVDQDIMLERSVPVAVAGRLLQASPDQVTLLANDRIDDGLLSGLLRAGLLGPKRGIDPGQGR